MNAHEQAVVTAASPTDSLLERLADKLGGRAKVDAVFGAPVQQGDLTVIPVALGEPLERAG